METDIHLKMCAKHISSQTAINNADNYKYLINVVQHKQDLNSLCNMKSLNHL